ncbi:MAG: hypothetical protein ACUVR8_02650 [Acidobacteriota bacterium]
MLTYAVYGLRLATTVRIPWLQPVTGEREAFDCTLSFVEASSIPCPAGQPWYCSAPPVSHQQPAPPPELTVYQDLGSGLFCFYFHQANVVFTYASSERQLAATWCPPYTFEDTCTYLTGPILAFILQIQQRVCLHASVVAMGGSAVAFVGPNGVGKSTLALALTQHNAQLITEDVAALEWQNAEYRVHLGPRSIRLWPPSVAAFYGRPNALPQISKHWEKQYLSFDSCNGPTEPVALTAVYLLELDAADAPVESQPLCPSLAVRRLLANVYPDHLPLPQARISILDTLTHLATAVPVYRLFLPDSFSRLGDVCDYLLARHG